MEREYQRGQKLEGKEAQPDKMKVGGKEREEERTEEKRNHIEYGEMGKDVGKGDEVQKKYELHIKASGAMVQGLMILPLERHLTGERISHSIFSTQPI